MQQQQQQQLFSGYMPINGKRKVLKTNLHNVFSTYLFNTPNMQPKKSGQSKAYYAFLYACWLSNNGLINSKHIINFAYAYTINNLKFYSFYTGKPYSHNIIFTCWACSKKQAIKIYNKNCYSPYTPNIKISPYITP